MNCKFVKFDSTLHLQLLESEGINTLQKNVCISYHIKSVERCWKYHISLLYHQLSIKLEIQSITNFPIFGMAKFLHLSKLEMNWKCIIGNEHKAIKM